MSLAFLFSKMGGEASAFQANPKISDSSSRASKDGVIIFLHDTGGSGHDLCVKLIHLGINKMSGANRYEWIFPTAPLRHFSLSHIQSTRWFDKTSPKFDSPEDIEGIAETMAKLVDIIESKRKLGYSLEDIYIGGFGTGGESSLYLLRYFASSYKLGGIFAFSCFLPKHSFLFDFFNKRGRDARTPPLLFIHGECDPVVPLNWVEETIRRFPKHCEIDFESTRCSHEIVLFHGRKLMQWIEDSQDGREEDRTLAAERRLERGFD